MVAASDWQLHRQQLHLVWRFSMLWQMAAGSPLVRTGKHLRLADVRVCQRFPSKLANLVLAQACLCHWGMLLLAVLALHVSGS